MVNNLLNILLGTEMETCSPIWNPPCSFWSQLASCLCDYPASMFTVLHWLRTIIMRDISFLKVLAINASSGFDQGIKVYSATGSICLASSWYMLTLYT